MRKFRRTPNEVFAIEVTSELLEFKRGIGNETEVHVTDNENYTLLIYRGMCVEVRTEDGKLFAEIGDWLVFEEDGNVIPVKKMDFGANYEAVTVMEVTLK